VQEIIDKLEKTFAQIFEQNMLSKISIYFRIFLFSFFKENLNSSRQDKGKNKSQTSKKLSLEPEFRKGFWINKEFVRTVLEVGHILTAINSVHYVMISHQKPRKRGRKVGDINGKAIAQSSSLCEQELRFGQLICGLYQHRQGKWNVQWLFNKWRSFWAIVASWLTGT
jgi:hypothetical protein